MCPCWAGTWILSAPFLVRLKGFNRPRRAESDKQKSVPRPALVVMTLREAPARDLFPLGQHNGIGYNSIRLQARRSRPAGKTMGPCWWPLQAAWGGGPPGHMAHKGASLKSGQNVFVSPPHKCLSSGRTTQARNSRLNEAPNSEAMSPPVSRTPGICTPEDRSLRSKEASGQRQLPEAMVKAEFDEKPIQSL